MNRKMRGLLKIRTSRWLVNPEVSWKIINLKKKYELRRDPKFGIMVATNPTLYERSVCLMTIVKQMSLFDIQQLFEMESSRRFDAIFAT